MVCIDKMGESIDNILLQCSKAIILLIDWMIPLLSCRYAFKLALSFVERKGKECGKVPLLHFFFRQFGDRINKKVVEDQRRNDQRLKLLFLSNISA